MPRVQLLKFDSTSKPDAIANNRLEADLFLETGRAHLDADKLTDFEAARCIERHSSFGEVIAQAAMDLIRVGDNGNGNSHAMTLIAPRSFVRVKASRGLFSMHKRLVLWRKRRVFPPQRQYLLSA